MEPLTYSRKHGEFYSKAWANPQFPMAHFRDEYLAPIPEAERQDLILAYHAQLNSVDEETRIKAAKAWSKWE
jgi:proline iminopeptidase